MRPPTAAAAPAVPPGDRLTTGLVMLAGFVLYALNVDYGVSGDAAMYADYVLLRKFDELTLHLGYYWLLWAAHATVGAAADLPIEATMAWLNVALGAIALGIAYPLARHLLARRDEALFATVVLALGGRMLTNATSSEIYALQLCLVLVAFLLFVRERVAAAGLAAGLALLVTPLSAFAFLFFPVLDLRRAGRIRWTVLLRLAAAAAVVYLPYLAVHWRELFWGRRGLLDVNDGIPTDVLALLTEMPRFQAKAFTFILPLAIAGLVEWRRRRTLLALTLAVTLPHLYLLTKLTSEDHVFVFLTDFFFACWAAVGCSVLAAHVGRVAAALPLVAHVTLLVVAGELFALDRHEARAADARRVMRSYVLGRDATMISDWDGVMTLTFFGRTRPATTIEREALFGQTYDIGQIPRMDPRLLEARELYLYDRWEPGGLRRLLTPRAAVEDLEAQRGLRHRARRDLSLHCTLVERATHPLYRCARDAAGDPAGDAP